VKDTGVAKELVRGRRFAFEVWAIQGRWPNCPALTETPPQPLARGSGRLPCKQIAKILLEFLVERVLSLVIAQNISFR
jgi:hypothetical protein